MIVAPKAKAKMSAAHKGHKVSAATEAKKPRSGAS